MQSYDGDSEETIDNDDFSGDMIKANFNELDLLEEIKLRSREKSNSEEVNSGQRLKHRKVKSSTVWFESPDGHLTFNILKNMTTSGLKLSLKFRTLSPDALLFVIFFEKNLHQEIIGVQLNSGFLKITRINDKNFQKSFIKERKFNDLKWHTIHLTEVDEKLRVSIENKTTEIQIFDKTDSFDSGKLYVGGIPSEINWPSGLTQTGGFRGCMASLKLGTEILDLWSDAETGTQVEKGCRGGL